MGCAGHVNDAPFLSFFIHQTSRPSIPAIGFELVDHNNNNNNNV
jgi:hypothetical protein